MATIVLTPLRDVVNQTQFEALPAAFIQSAADDVDRECIGEDINEIALEEFVERLDGDAADVYLPVRRMAVVEVDGLRFGSLHSLLDRLGALRSELELDLPVEERTRAFAKQRNIWKVLTSGARTSLQTGQVLLVENT